jgi:S-adenosylmethionine:diacylglycerol 3-amino-3-carboxypropyl transferase
MANKYEVTLTNGQVYDVTISKHHDDYTQNVWLGHLVDVLKTIVSNVATHHITNYKFKGRT